MLNSPADYSPPSIDHVPYVRFKVNFKVQYVLKILLKIYDKHFYGLDRTPVIVLKKCTTLAPKKYTTLNSIFQVSYSIGLFPHNQKTTDFTKDPVSDLNSFQKRF